MVSVDMVLIIHMATQNVQRTKKVFSKKFVVFKFRVEDVIRKKFVPLKGKVWIYCYRFQQFLDRKISIQKKSTDTFWHQYQQRNTTQIVKMGTIVWYWFAPVLAEAAAVLDPNVGTILLGFSISCTEFTSSVQL